MTAGHDYYDDLEGNGPWHKLCKPPRPGDAIRAAELQALAVRHAMDPLGQVLVIASDAAGDPVAQRAAVALLVAACHGASRAAGWWNDPETGAPLERNRGEMIALIHSELSELLEAERRPGRMDDHLPHRPSAEVELADALIRICDYAGGLGYDLAGALVEKLAYNAGRADHKREARLAEGGKRF